ncbi:hypothetical protein D8S78_07075 [Natrialba swarupiae]|nr:hypothetical protein [Natrialba swarupiae]
MPTLGQQIRYADVDVPTSGEPIYREWIARDGGWRTVRYATPNAMGEDVVGDRSAPEQVLRARLDYLGVGYDTYDHVLSVGPVTVCLGSFDAATVRDTVLETGYEERGDYAGTTCSNEPTSRAASPSATEPCCFGTGRTRRDRSSPRISRS